MDKIKETNLQYKKLQSLMAIYSIATEDQAKTQELIEKYKKRYL